MLFKHTHKITCSDGWFHTRSTQFLDSKLQCTWIKYYTYSENETNPKTSTSLFWANWHFRWQQGVLYVLYWSKMLVNKLSESSGSQFIVVTNRFMHGISLYKFSNWLLARLCACMTMYLCAYVQFTSTRLVLNSTETQFHNYLTLNWVQNVWYHPSLLTGCD